MKQSSVDCSPQLLDTVECECVLVKAEDSAGEPVTKLEESSILNLCHDSDEDSIVFLEEIVKTTDGSTELCSSIGNNCDYIPPTYKTNIETVYVAKSKDAENFVEDQAIDLPVKNANVGLSSTVNINYEDSDHALLSNETNVECIVVAKTESSVPEDSDLHLKFEASDWPEAIENGKQSGFTWFNYLEADKDDTISSIDSDFLIEDQELPEAIISESNSHQCFCPSKSIEDNQHGRTICVEEFGHLPRLLDHHERHSIDALGLYTCERSKKCFQFGNALTKHVKLHFEHEDRSAREDHEALPSKKSNENFCCYHCGKIYHKKNVLRKHISRHFDLDCSKSGSSSIGKSIEKVSKVATRTMSSKPTKNSGAIHKLCAEIGSIQPGRVANAVKKAVADHSETRNMSPEVCPIDARIADNSDLHTERGVLEEDVRLPEEQEVIELLAVEEAVMDQSGSLDEEEMPPEISPMGARITDKSDLLPQERDKDVGLPEEQEVLELLVVEEAVMDQSGSLDEEEMPPEISPMGARITDKSDLLTQERDKDVGLPEEQEVLELLVVEEAVMDQSGSLDEEEMPPEISPMGARISDKSDLLTQERDEVEGLPEEQEVLEVHAPVTRLGTGSIPENTIGFSQYICHHRSKTFHSKKKLRMHMKGYNSDINNHLMRHPFQLRSAEVSCMNEEVDEISDQSDELTHDAETDVMDQSLRLHEVSDQNKPMTEECQCSQCNETFSLEKKLHMHMKGHKSDINDTLMCHPFQLRSAEVSCISGIVVEVDDQSDELSHVVERDVMDHDSGVKEPFVQKPVTEKNTEILDQSDQLNHAVVKDWVVQEQDVLERNDFVTGPGIKSKCESQRFTSYPHYQCYHCNKIYNSKKKLELHIKSHISDLTGHSLTSSLTPPVNKTYVCRTCHKVFTALRNLRRHELMHSGEKPHHCECGASFSRSDKLLRHMRIEHKIYVTCLKCKECGEHFEKRIHLSKHMISHLGECSYICSVCGKIFRKFQYLRMHMKYHSDERSYLCSVCGRTFPVSTQLTSHMRSHSEECPFSCALCNKSFRYHRGLKRHIITHSRVKPHSCKTCGKKFYRYDKLRRHMVTHSGIKPYSCESCGEKFSRRDKVKRHMFMHSLYMFHCEVCTKTFYHPSYLRSHMKRHTSIDYCECPVCRLPFASQSSLSSHVAVTHIQSEDFECQQTKRGFYVKYVIDTLLKNSSAEKYTCDVCEVVFRSAAERNDHVAIHKEVLSCNLCKQAFRSAAEKRLHNKSVDHSIEEVVKNFRFEE